LGGLPRYALAATALSLCLAFGAAHAARAQISGSIGIQSDYRFRGISLTDRQPVATLSLAYDHPSGLYAGASVVGVDEDGPQALGFIEYAGYATQKIGPVSFDLGVNNQSLSEYADKRYPLNYSEIYVGVVGSHLSAHVYYSPNYFRTGVNTLYADVEGSMKPAENWRLFAHLGTTVPVGDIAGRHERFDLRAGLARQFGSFEVQAALTSTSPAPPALTPQERTALVFGANWFF
jgi:uncharacterized protein (TIGR02001 family)